MNNYTFPIIWGTHHNLESFDFSFSGMKIIDIESKEFEHYIASLNSSEVNSYNFIMQVVGGSTYDSDKKYAIIRINPLANICLDELKKVFIILLLIFPSDLQIIYEVSLTKSHDGWLMEGINSYDKTYINEYPGKLLYYHDECINEVNEFTKLVLKNLNKSNYIELAIYHYLTSYQTNHEHLMYSSLYTSLEAIIKGGTELKYRLSRNIAILCGENTFLCRTIYENIGKFSKLRNSLVHGENRTNKLLDSYILKLRSLVSRVIIELLIHEVPSLDKLEEKFTEIGFGDRNKITKNWKHFQLNLITLIDIGLPIDKK